MNSSEEEGEGDGGHGGGSPNRAGFSSGEFKEREQNEVIEERSPMERYARFNRKLGSGAFKTVYLGFDSETGKEIAWSKIDIGEMSSSSRRRIGNEIDLLKSVQHPRIIAFLNAWRNKELKQVNIITAVAPGGSLSAYIKRLPTSLKVNVMRTWCRQILEGLQYLHSKPIIHRDLKCENIFVDGSSGEVLIGDLGLSTALSDKKQYACSFVGTPEFIAPEVYEEKYDTAVDIYAFGMCMIEMISMGSPFKECSNPHQVFMKICRGEKPQVLRRVRDEELRTLVDSCISLQPEMRPTAQALLEHSWLRLNDGDKSNSCIELLPEEEAPSAHQPTLNRIAEDDSAAPSMEMHPRDGVLTSTATSFEPLQQGMLVHPAADPGSSLDQAAAIAPAWSPGQLGESINPAMTQPQHGHSLPLDSQSIATEYAEASNLSASSVFQAAVPSAPDLVSGPQGDADAASAGPSWRVQHGPGECTLEQDVFVSPQLVSNDHLQSASDSGAMQPPETLAAHAVQYTEMNAGVAAMPPLANVAAATARQCAALEASHDDSDCITPSSRATASVSDLCSTNRETPCFSSSMTSMAVNHGDITPPESADAVNFEPDVFNLLTDPPPTENEVREALRGIGLAHVENLDVVVAKNKKARFDFDVEQDTAYSIAKELQDAFDECNGVPIEAIAGNVGKEIMKRCREIAAEQSSRPTLHSVAPVDAARDSTSAGDGRESASKSQLAWAADAQHPRLSAEVYRRYCSGTPDSVLYVTEQVALLQRSLAFLIPDLREDSYERIGAWCEATTAAVASFQDYHKLSGERGTVDDKFWTILSDEHKKKEAKEERRKAQREEERRKAIEERELRKRCRDQESAAQLEAMMGNCKRSLEKESNNESASSDPRAPAKVGNASPQVASASAAWAPMPMAANSVVPQSTAPTADLLAPVSSAASTGVSSTNQSGSVAAHQIEQPMRHQAWQNPMDSIDPSMGQSAWQQPNLGRQMSASVAQQPGQEPMQASTFAVQQAPLQSSEQ
eukprot:TRINITY_DN2935_c0_g2_i1.p1 TRINITY_DN2935_c0_g2~~TRINITY_DN2935_c0_g2_i1.p1  ORF type:complete len:1016 (-),score=146.94 TRINITY_DN2935_c0_g2_i1:516-3563(-)